jgi:hypothetical protein
MIASILEKYTYGIATLILFLQDRVAVAVLAVGTIDLILGTLFIIAYIKVKKISVAS